MYKLVIADDEAVIRKGLLELINWNDLGFEVVASFNGGSHLIRYLHQNEVDVVLTDIKMGDVSGLEVARYISQNKRDTKIVLISGYKEFEYAQKAIDYNVEHYLLKPTNLEEIMDVFLQLGERLKHERSREKALAIQNRRYHEIIPVLQEQFFQDIILGGVRSQEELVRWLKLTELDIDPAAPCCLVTVKIGEYREYIKKRWFYEKERLNVALSNFSGGIKDDIKYYYVYYLEDELKIIAIASDAISKEAMYSCVENYLEEMRDAAKINLGVIVSTIIEDFYISLVEMALSIKPFRIVLDNDGSEPNMVLGSDGYKRLTKKIKMLVSYINENNRDKTNNLLESFMMEIQDLPIYAIRNIILEMMIMISNSFVGLGLDIRHITWGKYNYQSVIQMNDIDEIKALVHNTLNEVITWHKNLDENSPQLIIRRSIEYIEKNVYRDISLAEVADYIFLNPVYFSRFFKQHTGENFIDYITRIRVEKAIELLETGKYKAYEISSMVGYKSSKYFSKVFKQYTGSTLMDYSRKVVPDLG